MAVAGLIVGLLITALGMLGLFVPDSFVKVIGVFQSAPAIYLAAAIRTGFGIVLIRAAGVSRFPGVLRVLGLIVVLGGLLTPFVGVEGARIILGWWSAYGAAMVRVWALAAVMVGAFIIHAFRGVRRTA